MPWRLLQALAHLLTGAMVTLAVVALRALGRPPAWQPGVVRWWHQRLCRILALQVAVSGQVAERAMLVANHISWLDIPVLGAQGSIGFLSKAEVRRWPVIGWMAEVAGTLFIARGAHRFAEAIAAVRARIAAGFAVVVFAEGTTSDGTGVRRFLPRLFAVVQSDPEVESGSSKPRLQPVALCYGAGGERDAVAPFIDDDILVGHLWRVLKHPGIQVRVVFLPTIETGNLDRRRLAEAARDRILAACFEGQDKADFSRKPENPSAIPSA
jgi:1-acyl-sn-glycerol-3-phosphate acyltransferase